MRVFSIACVNLLLPAPSAGYSVNRYTFLTSSASTMVGVFAKDGYFKSSPTTGDEAVSLEVDNICREDASCSEVSAWRTMIL